jgi:hypothetical protein
LINVAELMTDPDFTQVLKVWRQTGEWIAGEFVYGEEVMLSVPGIVTVANVKDLEQVPEGDRVKGTMCFYSTFKLELTRNSPDQGTSDQIEWRGERYRLFQIMPQFDYGYNKAFGARMAGD